jgi:hypothetical protein
MKRKSEMVDLTEDSDDEPIVGMSALGYERSLQDDAYKASLALDRKRKKSAKVLQRGLRSLLQRKKTRAVVAAHAASRRAALIRPTSAAARRALMARAAEARRGGTRRR